MKKVLLLYILTCFLFGCSSTEKIMYNPNYDETKIIQVLAKIYNMHYLINTVQEDIITIQNNNTCISTIITNEKENKQITKSKISDNLTGKTTYSESFINSELNETIYTNDMGYICYSGTENSYVNTDIIYDHLLTIDNMEDNYLAYVYNVTWRPKGETIIFTIEPEDITLLNSYWVEDNFLLTKNPLKDEPLAWHASTGEAYYNEDLTQLAIKMIDNKYEFIIDTEGNLLSSYYIEVTEEYDYFTGEASQYKLEETITYSKHNEELDFDFSFLKNNKKGICTEYYIGYDKQENYENELWFIEK